MDVKTILNHIIGYKHIDKDLLIEYIAESTCNSVEDACRVAVIILGGYEAPNIPNFAIYDGKVAKFISFDKFKNSVRFTYTDTNIKYFTCQEDADKYIQTGNSYRIDSAFDPSDKYSFKGVYSYQVESNIDLSYWLDYSEKYVATNNK